MNSNIDGQHGGLTYTASSLEDIAGAFDRLGNTAAEQATRAGTQKAKRYKEGEAAAYRDAAKMLRATTIK